MLPLELYAHIFAFVRDNRDLCRISLVSRTFHRESTPFLYHTVDLTLRQHHMHSFCPTIKSNHDLALHVRILTLYLLPRYLSPSPLENLFQEILSSLHNLRVLTIEPSYLGFADFAVLTRDCQFQLRAFHNSAFGLPPTFRFLDSQPCIRDWTHTVPYDSGVTFLETRLPNLTTICVNATILPLFTTPRPVKQILFRETLVTFSWDRSLSLSGVGGAAAISLVAEAVPNLKHFCLIDVDEDHLEPDRVGLHHPLDDLLVALSRFKHLETFAYSPPMRDFTSPWWMVYPAEGSDHIARAFFSAQATLRLVAFRTRPSCTAHRNDWVASAKCYSKSPEGKIRKERHLPLRFDSWRELW
ncbi:hypothetical protein JAAARDRAFT_421803 [Jaapia argillacea MUCL 33604]|uniref:F-box domain-containing protein n=1 Tax=Jaapia argillacea MUCL 33604 TaxID=933084 RepID=A0A067PFP9_9AGAM|nr:hypothetical protein JAAARDRAFT_421803 [Jaapia argillacea MUCL 33604]